MDAGFAAGTRSRLRRDEVDGLRRDRAEARGTDSDVARLSPKGSCPQTEGLCTFSRRRRVQLPRPKAVHVQRQLHGLIFIRGAFGGMGLGGEVFTP